MTNIRQLAKFIADFHLADAPEAVVSVAKCCVEDTIGVAAGASLAEEIKTIVWASTSEGSGASVWGLSKKLAPSEAAFYNAMMAHYLELDDVHPTSKTHIGAVVVPAAWAMAEYLDASGQELLEGVICGYEIAARIGMGIGVSSHRNRGWHATGTVGIFGAAAACAKLLKLNEDMTVYALGMAGTQSSGLWSFLAEGATCKTLHTATAARNGMTAALMAKAGMTGAEHVLDAKDGGLFPAMSDDYNYSLVSMDLGGTFEILNMENKPYPCCRSTHCTIDAAFSLRKMEGFSVENIDHIEIATYLIGYRQCGCNESVKHPATATEARFSTPYTVSCVLLYGEMSEKYFSPPYLGSEQIVRLCEKISVHSDERFTSEYPHHWGCELTVSYKNGEERSIHIKDAFGSKNNPISAGNLLEKITPMLQGAYGNRAATIIDQICRLETLDCLPVLSTEGEQQYSANLEKGSCAD